MKNLLARRKASPDLITPTQIQLDRRVFVEPRRLKHRIGKLLASAGIVFFIGFAIFAFALAGEQIYEHLSAGSAGEESVLDRMLSGAYGFHLFAEIGIAFIIASVVSAFIEVTARREQTEAFKLALEEIGHSVVLGVYKVRHDEDYVKAVVSSCLAVRYIRRNIDISYHVSELSEKECDSLGIARTDFVRMNVTFSYDAENITERPATFEGVYTIPIRPGTLAPLSKMLSLKVDDKEYNEERCQLLEVLEGEPHFNAADRSYRFDIPTLPQRKPVHVRITSEFIKERSDTEIFAFLQPSIGATIRFNFLINGLSQIGAKARTASEMPAALEPHRREVEWKIPGPILPNNYVAVWWVTDPTYLEARANKTIDANASDDGPFGWQPTIVSGLAETEFPTHQEEHFNVDDARKTGLMDRLRSVINLAKGALTRRLGGTRKTG